MDYGHALEFGAFITPTNAQPEAPVLLAQLSEQLGFDLVTFQDHPYQPAFLDTWTLLSYTAAATSTIRLAPNVLNLPLRPPAVLARAAASLDLLSNGRFELALGSGAFWDAIEAMGAPRRTPGQALEALEEAIDLIRGIWNPDDRTPLPSGRYYPVAGAKRGPAPAHDIPIWIGALKPRMLRLTGRKADGWLPSLNFLEPHEISSHQERIDDAARGARRHPSEIRRMLNVAPGMEPARLADFTLTHGFSTFIVASDDPNALSQFAQETAPKVRELVDAERARQGTPAPGRSARALAARREGVSYDEVPASLADKTIEPGDFDYRSVRSTYLRGGSPGIVLRPEDTAGVQDAVAFARDHRHLPLGIRSGGHGVSGRSTNDGGVVIDVGGLNSIEVFDEQRRLVRVGPGARWQEVARALEPYGWAISSGDYGGVGVGGLATAGGIGFLGREHGLTIDQLVAVEIVLADGTLVRSSETENPDLFWAVRGAGANVGIVVSFEFEATPTGKVAWVQLAFDASDTAVVLQRYAQATESAPRDTTLFLVTGTTRGASTTVARLYGVIDSDDTSVIIERLQPFLAMAPLLDQSVQLGSYADVIANAPNAPHDAKGEPGFRSGLLDELGPDTAAVAAELVQSGSTPWFQIRPVGGAISDVPEDATAYAHRAARYSVTAVGRSDAFDEQWNRLEERFEGLYLSFESRTGPDIVARAFPPATLEKLRTLKEKYDPESLFRDNFPVR